MRAGNGRRPNISMMSEQSAIQSQRRHQHRAQNGRRRTTPMSPT
jgi:hypothetical protein